MMTEFIAPEGLKLHSFDGQHGGSVRYGVAQARQSPARGTVFVCPGRTEFIEKYFPVVEAILSRGFAVFIIDWPGQGASDRMLSDPLKGHVDHFDTFVSALVDGLAAAGDLPVPHVLLAHSMGGGIGLSALTKGKISVSAAAFCAPMWGIQTPIPLMKTITKTLNAVGMSAAYVAKPGPDDAVEDSAVTYCQTQWQRNKALEAAFPAYCLGMPTVGWAKAAIVAMDAFKVDGVIEAISCPVFVARAGDEMLVDNRDVSAIAGRFADVETKLFPAAKHELMFEREATQAAFWQGFDRLLARADL